MEGRYVFRVTVRIEAVDETVSVVPETAETTVTVSREAPKPGSHGWLFFRDTLWRGEVGDHDYACRLAEDWLGEPVESISFREFQMDTAYREAFGEAIADDLEAFNAESVSEVLSKYLGSSIRVESTLD